MFFYIYICIFICICLNSHNCLIATFKAKVDWAREAIAGIASTPCLPSHILLLLAGNRSLLLYLYLCFFLSFRLYCFYCVSSHISLSLDWNHALGTVRFINAFNIVTHVPSPCQYSDHWFRLCFQQCHCHPCQYADHWFQAFLCWKYQPSKVAQKQNFWRKNLLALFYSIEFDSRCLRLTQSQLLEIEVKKLWWKFNLYLFLLFIYLPFVSVIYPS